MFLLFPAPALAADPEEIVVTGEHDPSDPASTSAQVTVVDVDGSLPGSADVATAVARAPGVQVQRLGGLGDLAQVGIRGASSRQVEVMLDGIPLNPEGGASVDLSELPLSAFARVDVYRGLPPVLLGTGAIGGVVDLVTGDPDVSRTALSGGSWGTARASAASGSATPAGEVWGAADGLVTAGSFRWYDDGGTRLDAADDEVVPRANNDTRQLSTVLRWRVGDPRRVRATLLHTGLWRDEGLPGFTFAPTRDVRYGVSRHLGAAGLEGVVGVTRVTARLHGLVRDEELDDRQGEIGVGTRWLLERTATVGGVASARHPISPQVRLDLSAGGQVDGFRSEDLQSGGAPAEEGRQVGRAAAGLAFGPSDGGWVATPAVLGLGASGRALILPRAGLKVRLGPATVLKANAGLAARPPDVIELYGDRGTLVGNPDLLPERGASLDLGLRAAADGLGGEIVGFHRVVDDLIAWSQTPQGVARPDNVDRASVSGVEFAGDLRGELGEIAANGALTHAVDGSDDAVYAGNQLPRVPLVEVDLRGALTPGPVRLATDLSATAGTFADRANFVRQPVRWLWGATTGWSSGAWTLELDVRNLLDDIVATVPRDPLVDDATTAPAAVVDLTGYPLPGRTFLMTVRFQP